MKGKNESKFYSSHNYSSQKLPDILSSKTGFLRVLQQQQNKSSKREGYKNVIK